MIWYNIICWVLRGFLAYQIYTGADRGDIHTNKAIITQAHAYIIKLPAEATGVVMYGFSYMAGLMYHKKHTHDYARAMGTKSLYWDRFGETI